MTFRGCYWDQAFVESYIERRVSEWVNAVECLSSIAHTQPHAAYAAFTHGLMSKWTYITRAISNIGDLLSPLEDVIRRKFLTSLLGQTNLICCFSSAPASTSNTPLQLSLLPFASGTPPINSINNHVMSRETSLMASAH